MKLSISLLLVAFSLICCKSKYSTPYDYPGERLTFGSMGGFAGKVTEYTLLSNGDFYRGTGSEGFVDQLSHDMKDRGKQFFKSYEQLHFDTLNIDKTGNMTYYIVMYKKDKSSHRIQWADYVEEAPPELKIYHKNLFAFAKAVNAKSKESLPVK
ncbi:hypothetical protein N9L92_03470 [Saprospiraceae bacterium]|nr:hypothetical protein [Saprospiraceae bacterium]